MNKLLTGFCVLALGTGVLAGCTERSERVTERERVSPSASPGTRVDSTTRSNSTSPTPPPPSSSSSESSATSSAPSKDAGSSSSSSTTTTTTK